MPFASRKKLPSDFVGRLERCGNSPQLLQIWDCRSDTVVTLRTSWGIVQQFGGTLDGDGCWPQRKGYGVSIRVGMESKDYRLLRYYSEWLGLGPVYIHGQKDEVYLEPKSRSRVAALLQLLQGQAQHPEKIRQFTATAQRLGYDGDCPPRFQGRDSYYFAGLYDADGSGGIYRDARSGQLMPVFSLQQKALLLSPEEAARLPEGNYWRSSTGECYGHNPVVPLLQQTFGGKLSFSSFLDSKDVLRVNSRWKAASLEDLRRFSDYLQRCPPRSAKGR